MRSLFYRYQEQFRNQMIARHFQAAFPSDDLSGHCHSLGIT
jgi:hypothetical protein